MTEEIKKPSPKPSRRRDAQEPKKRIIMIVAIALVIGVLALGFAFYNYWNSGLEAMNPKDTKDYQIEIPVGSSTKQIGSILEDKGIVKSGFVFSYYAKSHAKKGFQAGYYALSPSMDVKKVVSTLEKGGSTDPRGIPIATITIPEGYTVDQIGDLIEKKTDFSKDEFLNLMRNRDFYNKMEQKYPELLQSEESTIDQVRYYFEGYLYPATYNLYKKESLEEFVEEILGNMNTVMKEFYEPIKQQNLTVQHVLTLASLVEKEGVTEEDRRKIAGVFFNRIEKGMPLQSDISVTYAMGEHKVHLSVDDVKTQSPYNLYINPGFGPGPFNNPSKAAIDAVVYPEKNDYLYFIADIKTGKVYFAKTFEEHEKLCSQYIEGYNNK